MVFLLIASLLFSPVSSLAEEGKGKIRVYKVAEDKYRFESCELDKECVPVGREEGYTRAEMDAWKKFKKSTGSDIIPMMGIIAATGLVIASIAFAPITAVVAAGALLVGAFGYFFYQSPQIQARMPNDVYGEFDSDPALLPEFKKFLREIDQGVSITDQNPRILSGAQTPKAAPEVEDKPVDGKTSLDGK